MAFEYNPFTDELDLTRSNAELDSRYLKLSADNGPITGQLALNIATGTSPFLITSTTVNTNLNSDLLDGLHDTAFLKVANNLSDLNNVATARTNLGLVSGGTGDIWVEKVGDTMTGPLFIDGSADQIQLRIQAHSTQTTNLQTWENSSAGVLGSFSGSGVLTIAGAATTSTGAVLDVTQTKNPTATGGFSFARVRGTIAMPSNITVAQDYYCLNTSLVVTAANYTTTNTQLRSLYLSVENSNPNTIGIMYGGFVDMYNFAAGTVNTMYGYGGYLRNTGTGTVGSGAFIAINDMVNSGGGTVNYQYGILIQSQTKGSIANYAILTNAGNIVFNEVGDANTDLRVESDTEANMIFLDSNGDTDGTLHLGGVTNGIKINKGGSLKYLGSSSGVCRGSMYADDVSITVTVSSSSVYYPITSGLTTGLTNNFTFQNNSELKCLVAGVYSVTGHISASSAVAAEDIAATVMVNSTHDSTSEGTTYSTTPGKAASISFGGHIRLAVNDIVRIAVENEDAAHDITITHAGLYLHQIGG